MTELQILDAINEYRLSKQAINEEAASAGRGLLAHELDAIIEINRCIERLQEQLAIVRQFARACR
jgi:hypothetical protein